MTKNPLVLAAAVAGILAGFSGSSFAEDGAAATTPAPTTTNGCNAKGEKHTCKAAEPKGDKASCKADAKGEKHSCKTDAAGAKAKDGCKAAEPKAKDGCNSKEGCKQKDEKKPDAAK